jgi:DNA-binding transcriptional LysR family regulator
VSVYERAARMVAAADDAARSVAGVGPEPRGQLRVNGPVGFSQMHLASALADFLRGHPAVTIDLVVDDHVVNLVEKGFDLAIRVQINRATHSSLVARKLAEDDLLICAAPSYLSRAGAPRTPTDLLRHDCLRYSSLSSGGEWRFRGPDGPFSVPVRGSLVASDGGVLREAVLAGLGLTVLPRFMVQSDLDSGRLRTVLDGTRRRRIGVYAVYPHRQTPAHLRALLDFLAARFSGGRWQAASAPIASEVKCAAEEARSPA